MKYLIALFFILLFVSYSIAETREDDVKDIKTLKIKEALEPYHKALENAAPKEYKDWQKSVALKIKTSEPYYKAVKINQEAEEALKAAAPREYREFEKASDKWLRALITYQKAKEPIKD